ncbi:MAG: alpha-galactosidase, partial [Ferruginibacter sp.]
AYPDGDMLPLGHLGIKAERGVDRMSLFTKDEHYTVMTLWCMFRSPLMFGGDLPGNDAFTLSLLTNKEVLYILNHSTNNRQLFNADNKIAWTADDPATGDKYVALFNAADTQQTINMSVLTALGVTGNYTLKNLWTGKLEQKTSPTISVIINPHGTILYKLSKRK